MSLVVALFAVAQFSAKIPPIAGDDAAYLALEEKPTLATAMSPRFTTKRAQDGLFHVAALINGQPVDLALDTGATRTVLAPSDARSLGLAGRSGRYSHMQTINGRVRLQRAFLAELRIGDQTINDLDIAIGPQTLSQSIAGLDILTHSGPILIEADRLTILGDEAQRQ